ncbi:hypothetical protein [Pseudochryseolinea flava]|nr:hypothetical protein [Pseudochryseolinea flava]
MFAFMVIERVAAKYKFADANFLRSLLLYHALLSVAYYGYVAFNPSDSKFYYRKVLMNFRGPEWMDFYGTSTTFIEFVGYPFIKIFGFSYEAVMVLFSFFGFLGFIYFYIFFKENIKYKHKVFGFDLMTLVFFLPNLHFWSSSFGKGSIIFLGIGLYFFGISKIKSRIPAIIIGGFIVYHVRPHILLVMLVSSAIGFVFSSKGVSVAWRVFFLMCASIVFFFIYKNVLAAVGIDESELMTDGLDLTHRANELSKAGSGVNISNYSLGMQVFTFLYRPLFFDAPGALGLIVSVENVFYLFITMKLLGSWNGIKFMFTGSFYTKSALLSFITVSIALAQISGNLGIAMRQKSQIMILLMFVVLVFLDEEHQKKLNKQQLVRRRMAQTPIQPIEQATPNAIL